MFWGNIEATREIPWSLIFLQLEFVRITVLAIFHVLFENSVSSHCAWVMNVKQKFCTLKCSTILVNTPLFFFCDSWLRVLFINFTKSIWQCQYCKDSSLLSFFFSFPRIFIFYFFLSPFPPHWLWNWSRHVFVNWFFCWDQFWLLNQSRSHTCKSNAVFVCLACIFSCF